MSGDIAAGYGGIIAGQAVIFLYFLPTLVALERSATKALFMIIFLNLVFGWTIISWIVCLLWAVLGQTREQPEYYALTVKAARGETNCEQ
jgi:hypothetical protein